MAEPVEPRMRLQRVDVARGVALLAMAVYHFSWDLAYVGLVDWPVATGAGWRGFAMGIAASFLFLVGFSLVLATRRGVDRRAFLGRLGRVAGGALLVSLATWWLFPATFVYFGILHHIAVASVLGLLFLRLPLVLVAAALALVLLLAAYGPWVDAPLLVWTGLSSFSRPANDFVPLFPWFAAVLAGIAAARLVPLRLLAGAPGRVGRAFAAAGRHSLAIYLLHQPLLFALAMGLASLVPLETRFSANCSAGCAAAGTDGETCQRFCACVTEALGPMDYFADGAPAEDPRLAAAAAACPVVPLH